MKLCLLLCVVFHAIVGCQYKNPVLAVDFPDPTVIRGHDGMFYAYATMGNFRRLQVASSKNLCDWTYVGEALNPPLWWDGLDTWAPEVVYDSVSSLYFMYFAASSPSSYFCIAVASSASPLGPFTDAIGKPLICGNDPQNKATVIDPKFWRDDDGTPYLFFGSDFAPINARMLSNFTTLAPGAPTLTMLRPDGNAPYEVLIEGAWIVKGPKAFFLFYSGNNCCAPNSHYAVMVARSTKVTGPWTKLGQALGQSSSVILEQSHDFVAPGHNSVVFDDAGVGWIFYHAYPGAEGGPRALLMDRVDFNRSAGGTNDWPSIRGGQPSSGTQQGPTVNHLE